MPDVKMYDRNKLVEGQPIQWAGIHVLEWERLKREGLIGIDWKYAFVEKDQEDRAADIPNVPALLSAISILSDAQEIIQDNPEHAARLIDRAKEQIIDVQNLFGQRDSRGILEEMRRSAPCQDQSG